MRPHRDTTSPDPERIRFAVSAFPVLQGLKQVPIGLFSLVVFVSHAGLWPWHEIRQPLSGLACLLLAVAMHKVLDVYYGRVYGRVEHTEEPGQHRTVALVVLALIGAFFVDVVFAPPVSVVGLALAAWYTSAWLEAKRFRSHYAATAAVLALVGLLPLSGAITPEQHFDVVLPAVFGLAMIANGVVDHFQLLRLLPPAARANRAS